MEIYSGDIPPPGGGSRKAVRADSRTQYLVEMRRTATMITPKMDMTMTAPSKEEYSASAPSAPAYSVMVGARIVAITITDTVMVTTAPTIEPIDASFSPPFTSDNC